MAFVLFFIILLHISTHLANGSSAYTCSSEWTTAQYLLPCHVKLQCPNGKLEIDRDKSFYGLGKQDMETNTWTNLTCKQTASYLAVKCSGNIELCDFVCQDNSQCIAHHGSTEWLKPNYIEVTCRCVHLTTPSPKMSDNMISSVSRTTGLQQTQASIRSTTVRQANSTAPSKNETDKLTTGGLSVAHATTPPAFQPNGTNDVEPSVSWEAMIRHPIFIVVASTVGCIIAVLIVIAAVCGYRNLHNANANRPATTTPDIPKRNSHSGDEDIYDSLSTRAEYFDTVGSTSGTVSTLSSTAIPYTTGAARDKDRFGSAPEPTRRMHDFGNTKRSQRPRYQKRQNRLAYQTMDNTESASDQYSV